MADYKLIANSDAVTRTADGFTIPNDPGNGDWLVYQAWLDGGGVPDPVVPFVAPSLDTVGHGPTTLEILGVA